MKGSATKKEHYEKMFRQYYHQLYHYALRLVDDGEWAADITNDAFCHLWEKYDDLDLSDTPLPWLYTVVRNYATDHLRHIEVVQRNNLEICRELWEMKSMEDILEHERKIKMLMTYMDLLPEQTRKVFNECFMHKRKYKEVADELNISVNTVKTYISRALQYLRDRAKEEHLQ